MIELPRPSTA
jgi:centrosomal protein CEP104